MRKKVAIMGMNEKTVFYVCLASAIALGSSQVQAVGETAYGFEAGGTGDYNTAFGHSALRIGPGEYNTAIGYLSLFYNTGGESNTASGANSLYSNTTGDYNTASGDSSLYL